MTGPFVPGPPVPNLPKANPDAPGSQPRPRGPLDEGGVPRSGDIARGGNINPDVKLDTSTTRVDPDSTYNGPAAGYNGNTGRTSGGMADGGAAHYTAGHQLGSALGAHISNQIMAQLAQLFDQ